MVEKKGNGQGERDSAVNSMLKGSEREEGRESRTRSKRTSRIDSFLIEREERQTDAEAKH